MKTEASDAVDTQGFCAALIEWQRRHGRHDLPWQSKPEPYRVWLSEIMLQQTQVATVRAYFERFVACFPDVQALASAPLDDVLGLWSGLGYYSRARNLHRCAQLVVEQHAGVFPQTAAQLQTLPGIGPSTAAAVASICFGERVAILDGNVKRVLTRYLGFEADLAQAVHERALWQIATDLLPKVNLKRAMPRYTQAVMDLGATVCTPRQPHCDVCPLHADCRAVALGCPQRFPVKTRKLKRGTQNLWLLWAQTKHGAVWLEQRPVSGIWGGLYCLPLFDSQISLSRALSSTGGLTVSELPGFKHVLTHKDLYLYPVRVTLSAAQVPACLGGWVSAQRWPTLGLPAPVRVLLSGQVASISR